MLGLMRSFATIKNSIGSVDKKKKQKKSIILFYFIAKLEKTT